MMERESNVTHTLTELDIPHRLHLHEQPLRSLQQAAEERGLNPEQIVRSLLFRLGKGEFILVLMPGTRPVSWPKLRHFLGVSRLTMATTEEVREITGYEPGTVSPFGLKIPLRILADHSLRELKVISMGAGIPNAGVIMQCQDLIGTLQLEWADLGGN